IRSMNRKITDMIQSGRLEEARAFFDSMPFRNTISWNSMLSGYVRHREIVKARRLFDEMPKRDVVSWNLMIQGYVTCRSRRYVEEGRFLFDIMPEKDFVSWNTMISGYAKNGRIQDSFTLFTLMPDKNTVTWNAMITGFLSNGDVRKASELFKQMPRRDAASISALVSGLIRNNELDEAENVLFEYGKACDKKQDLIHAYNTLIAGYGQTGRVDDARRIFNGIPTNGNEGKTCFVKNTVSWNSMLMAYVMVGDMVSAAELFDGMLDRDIVSWNTMISGYVHVSDMKTAEKLFSEMPLPDSLSWNSIISGFAQDGNMGTALEYFHNMPEKNLISWNTVISGFDKNSGYREAIELFLRMQAEGEKPDRHTLSSILSVCADSVEYNLGMQIHQLVIKLVIPDVPLNNSLITMYARSGAILEATLLFDNMGIHKDVISWNSMIGGYASHGNADMALELFESMKLHKITPTYITFISVLSACARSGLVEEAKSYFRSMISDFGIEPTVEHFASLVDVVGRYGKIEEAMDIINGMGAVEADKGVWGALLGACRVHRNVEIARISGEALMKLEPQSSGPYILLYNMYVEAGKWNEADEIRIVMEKKNIKKERGYS
ncbi:hypothetical protein M569_03667, partial [Genlisea aurea]